MECSVSDDSLAHYLWFLSMIKNFSQYASTWALRPPVKNWWKIFDILLFNIKRNIFILLNLKDRYDNSRL